LTFRRAERRSFTLPRLFRAGSRSSLWERYGLVPGRTQRADRADQSRPDRFRLALEESGGLFARYGQFLSGRADLLPGEYLARLRNIRLKPREALAPASLPEVRSRIAESRWQRSFPCSEVYFATFRGQPVAVELFEEENPQHVAGFSRAAWQELERELTLLRTAPESAVARPQAVEQFREWMTFQSDVARKRAILRSLQDVPLPCATRFPRLTAELQSARCLGYALMQGTPLPEALASSADEGRLSAHALDLWNESWLEQALLLSLLDAAAQPESYVLLPDGALGMQTVPALIPVPVEWHHELLQYLTAAVSGNSHRALQMLARICSSENPYATERLLQEHLAALQPELKVHQSAPATLVALENYWRALAQSSLRPPLFLQLFHRNLVVLGYSSPPELPVRDLVSESLWPVLARILQFRIGELLASEKGTELLASTALLTLSGMRQMAVTLEQMRDNDLALEVEAQPSEQQDRRRNRRTAAVIRSGFGLVLFLIALQVAQRSAGALQVGATAVAALCAAAVCILVARIE
jgi:hypothetical protein